MHIYPTCPPSPAVEIRNSLDKALLEDVYMTMSLNPSSHQHLLFTREIDNGEEVSYDVMCQLNWKYLGRVGICDIQTHLHQCLIWLLACLAC